MSVRTLRALSDCSNAVFTDDERNNSSPRFISDAAFFGLSDELAGIEHVFNVVVSASQYLEYASSQTLQFYVVSTRVADKSLLRPGRKQARKHVRDARNFNNVETRAVKFFFSCKARRRRKFTPF